MRIYRSYFYEKISLALVKLWARAQALEMASRTARLRNRRRPNAVREMHDIPEIESGVIGDELQAGGAQQLRADLTSWQKNTDQRLDQIVTQVQRQGSQQNDLAKQLEIQNSRHDDVMTQMQSNMAMMGKLVNSFTPTPNPDGRPQQETPPQSRQLFESGGNSQNSAANGAGRCGLKNPWTQGACFGCGQVGHIAKGCPAKSANHLNYQGPGQ